MSTIEVGKVNVKLSEFSKGVNISHSYYNAGEKEIKYITFFYLPYNSVNDIVTCEVSKRSEASCRVTGPSPPKYQCHSFKREHIWYNETVSKVIISKIRIQYMDNTEEAIHGNDIVDMFAGGRCEADVIFFKNDLLTFTSKDETITLNTNVGGEHYLHVLSVDKAGNKKETI